ncbi:MAG TPA: peptidylprolyl isomerase, partial [Chloroflexota bacterium]
RQAVADFQTSTNPSPTLEPTPLAEASPTPEAGTAATPASTPSATSAALNPALTPTAVPTLDAAGYGPALQQLLDQNNLTEAELRKQLEASMLRNSLQTAIGQSQVADTQEQVHARQIQVASAQQANDLLSQLQGGADFAQLAQQNSTDATSANNGGDMGWFGRGVKAKTIEDATFALQPGQLSDVIQDSSGFHVIQLLERDPARPVPADQLATQRQKAFTDWLTSQRSSQDVKIQLDQGQKDWILARIGIRP